MPKTSSRVASPRPVPGIRCWVCQPRIFARRRRYTSSRTAGAASPVVMPVVRPSILSPQTLRLTGALPVAFAGLGFLTFYLAGKLRLFDTRGHAVGTLFTLDDIHGTYIYPHTGQGVAGTRTPWHCFLGGDFACDGLPTCVLHCVARAYSHSCFRVHATDHWQDILTGSALGLGIAYFSYRQYYPHLASKIAHFPFKTRFEEVEHDLDDVMTIFRDGDTVDNEEEAGLIGGSRKPQTDPEQPR